MTLLVIFTYLGSRNSQTFGDLQGHAMFTISRTLFFNLLIVALLAASGGLAVQAAEWRDAGPIWNNMDAERKCPKVCGSDRWDGNWKTTVQGQMSVCACGGKSKTKTYQVDAGPIWNNMDAERKCPAACGNAKWDGNWRTVSPGRSSTCDCKR